MSSTTKNPFVSFVNAYCGLVASQLSDMSAEFDKVVTKSNDVFNELASRGVAVEADLKKSMPRSDKMNQSIKNWFDAFSFGSAKRDKQLNTLSKKVDDLIEQVALLAEKKAREASAAKAPAAKPAAKRAPAKAKATTKPAAKATESKPATKASGTTKTTTRKTTTRKPAAKKATTPKKPAATKPKAPKAAE
ncbi:hypothetical protein [Alteromonas facilis]|uniref:hypothetical protein n=1 Tax=Alteromonas facilis TaxID=2048004 RepID=UPI000C284DA8|nr:hypothetical protein [Alteromonas facilis]